MREYWRSEDGMAGAQWALVLGLLTLLFLLAGMAIDWTVQQAIDEMRNVK